MKMEEMRQAMLVKSMRLDPPTIALRERIKASARFTDQELEERLLLALLYLKREGGKYRMPESRDELYKELSGYYNGIDGGFE